MIFVPILVHVLGAISRSVCASLSLSKQSWISFRRSKKNIFLLFKPLIRVWHFFHRRRNVTQTHCSCLAILLTCKSGLCRLRGCESRGVEGGWRGASQQGVYHIKGFSLAAFFLSSESLPPLRAFLSLTHHVHSPIHERARVSSSRPPWSKHTRSLYYPPPSTSLSISPTLSNCRQPLLLSSHFRS